VLNLLLKNANTVAISLSFFTFGFVLGKDVFNLTPEQEFIVLTAGAACGFAILMKVVHVSKTVQG
jgi:hypothetical protein